MNLDESFISKLSFGVIAKPARHERRRNTIAGQRYPLLPPSLMDAMIDMSGTRLRMSLAGVPSYRDCHGGHVCLATSTQWIAPAQI